MKFRNASAILVGVVGAALFSSQSQAAVTVIGNGLGAKCYQIAEFQGDPKDGVQTCTDALSSTVMSVADRAATLVNRGIMRSRMGDHDGALNDYTFGINMNPVIAEGYIDRGATLISMGRYQDALNDINHGISLGPKRPEIAHYDRAIAREAVGDIRGAYEDYKKALELEPKFGQASIQLKRFHVVRSSGVGGA